MKLLSLVVIHVLVEIVTPLHCRCTGNYCDSDILDTCYTVYPYCFTQIVGGLKEYGCVNNLLDEIRCEAHTNYTTCCTTDLCNSKGLPPKPYLPVPSIKLVHVEKRNVTINIKDTFKNRRKIDGYIATAYTPGINRRTIKKLAPWTRVFTFAFLDINTTFVIEVVSYRGRLTSERSAPITIKTESPECDYYQKGDTSGKKTERCNAFGCISIWNKNGTNIEIRKRGCWNEVIKPNCIEHPMDNGTVFIICYCNKKKCTLKTRS